MVKEVKMWETSDGQLFNHQPMAVEHEIELTTRKELAIVLSMDPSIKSIVHGDTVLEFIIANRYKILSLLRGEDQCSAGHP